MDVILFWLLFYYVRVLYVGYDGFDYCWYLIIFVLILFLFKLNLCDCKLKL